MVVSITMLTDRDPGAARRTSGRQLRLPFGRKSSTKDDMHTRSTKASSEEPLNSAAKRPSLLTPRQLCALYPIKLRTLKYWVQHAADREVSCQGRKRTIPGNGLAPAIVRKGRLIFLDENLFLAWLYEAKK